MPIRAKSLKHILFSVLLVFSQWASAEHGVDFSVGHVHGIDCTICVFDKLAFIGQNAQDPESKPQILFVSLAQPSEVFTPPVYRSSIRAPPR